MRERPVTNPAPTPPRCHAQNAITGLRGRFAVDLGVAPTAGVTRCTAHRLTWAVSWGACCWVNRA